MNLDQLHNKVIAVARQSQPGDRVPYAFEKRVMARLMERPADTLAEWGAALWRAAFTCVLVVVLSGAWAMLSSSSSTSAHRAEADLSQDFDTAVFASVGSADDVW